MESMLAHALPGAEPTVERMALSHNPMRAGLALLQNYIETRGAPRALVLEMMFMTPRSVDRLAQRGLDTAPEQYIFRRDLNLMTYEQIFALPAVAMPFSEEESWLNLLRFRLRGAVLRAGALTYQFLRRPWEDWDLAACDEQDWTREPGWPDDFAFSYGSYRPQASPDAVIAELEAVMAESATGRALKPWQIGVPIGQDYPYDFGSAYRQGEVALLQTMLELAARHDVPVLLLPLPLYGYVPAADELRGLAAALPGKVKILDLYTEVQGDLDKFWYDDGHLEPFPAGALTTALLTRHLLHAGPLGTAVVGQRLD
jgi:hypothetical protein